MAEAIKEFINATNLSYSDLLAGVPIVINGPEDSAVLKDVAIMNPKGRPLVLSVGPATIAKANGTCQLQGSELVGPGTSLHLKLASGGAMNEFYLVAGQQVVKYRCSTIYDKDGSGPLAILNITNVGPALNGGGTPTFCCFDASGNFYYVCSNDSNLYRRAGGVNGPQTSYGMGNAAYCYDGVRYIYCFSSSTSSVYTFDTQTTAVTVKSVGFNARIGFSYASALDGRIYVRTVYGAPYLVNPSAGTSIVAPGVSPAETSQLFVGLGKDELGNYILWQTDSQAPNLNWWNIGKDLNAPVVQGLGEVGGLTNWQGSQDYGCAVRQVGSTSTFWVSGTNGLWKFDTRTKELINLTLPNGSFPGGNPPLYAPPVSHELASDDLGLVNIRATGISIS